MSSDIAALFALQPKQGTSLSRGKNLSAGRLLKYVETRTQPQWSPTDKLIVGLSSHNKFLKNSH